MVSMADNTPRGDSKLRGFARKIARLKRDLRILETAAQGAHRSVEEGAIDFYDEDGVLRQRIGKQTDGSYDRRIVSDTLPPAPTEPDVVVIADGVVAVTWDGRFEEKLEGTFRAVKVHCGDTVDFTPTRKTQEGAIFSRRGGTVVVVTESDDDNPVYVRLVATNKAHQDGPPSDGVLVDELDEGGYEDDEELEWEDRDGRPITQAEVDAGTVTLSLSHDPEVKSLTAVFAGVPQRFTNFTVDYAAQTLTIPLSGWEKAGDVLWVHYPYRAGLDPNVPYQSDGWRYLQAASGDTVDRSATNFDDSAWALGKGGFGNSNTVAGYTRAYDPNTVVSTGSVVWIRRHIVGNRTYVVSARADDFVDVYWNGTLLGSGTGANKAEDPSAIEAGTWTVPANLVTADNVVAAKVRDATGTQVWIYLDLQVQEA